VKLLLATGNPGKLGEIRTLLALPGLDLLVPADLGCAFDVTETAGTFEGNARLKAEAACRQFGMAALADDSGLEIDALGRAPGVHSARFLGPAVPYPERHAEILRRLAGLPDSNRTARFRCCVALALPAASTAEIFTGTCEGRIAPAPRGTLGFGYDPIFIPEGFTTTFAEMTPARKNRLSHRAQALALVRPRLAGLIAAANL
jgi:XTP/dITP diphosphohydrolase